MSPSLCLPGSRAPISLPHLSLSLCPLSVAFLSFSLLPSPHLRVLPPSRPSLPLVLPSFRDQPARPCACGRPCTGRGEAHGLHRRQCPQRQRGRGARADLRRVQARAGVDNAPHSKALCGTQSSQRAAESGTCHRAKLCADRLPSRASHSLEQGMGTQLTLNDARVVVPCSAAYSGRQVAVKRIHTFHQMKSIMRRMRAGACRCWKRFPLKALGCTQFSDFAAMLWISAGAESSTHRTRRKNAVNLAELRQQLTLTDARFVVALAVAQMRHPHLSTVYGCADVALPGDGVGDNNGRAGACRWWIHPSLNALCSTPSSSFEAQLWTCHAMISSADHIVARRVSNSPKPRPRPSQSKITSFFFCGAWWRSGHAKQSQPTGGSARYESCAH